MSTVIAQELTLADVLRQLGGISPRRVRFRPAPGTATEEDVIKIRDRERRLFELIDGVLVEKVLGYWESVLAIELARLLGNFVRHRRLGTLAGEAGMLRLSPGLVRIPDLSFISRARLTHHRRARAPILPLAPDLAIEVLSEGNTPREMARSRCAAWSSPSPTPLPRPSSPPASRGLSATWPASRARPRQCGPRWPISVTS